MRAGHGEQAAAKTRVTMTAEVLRVKQGSGKRKNGYQESTSACGDHEPSLCRERCGGFCEADRPVVTVMAPCRHRPANSERASGTASPAVASMRTALSTINPDPTRTNNEKMTTRMSSSVLRAIPNEAPI
jgi:hypothetical protein